MPFFSKHEFLHTRPKMKAGTLMKWNENNFNPQHLLDSFLPDEISDSSEDSHLGLRWILHLMSLKNHNQIHPMFGVAPPSLF